VRDLIQEDERLRDLLSIAFDPCYNPLELLVELVEDGFSYLKKDYFFLSFSFYPVNKKADTRMLVSSVALIKRLA